MIINVFTPNVLYSITIVIINVLNVLVNVRNVKYQIIKLPAKNVKIILYCLMEFVLNNVKVTYIHIIILL